MFKDYYQILETKPPITEQELKTVYRKQCIKWHPDKNPNQDTTQIMQDIVEAYVFLKDSEARSRYDTVYYDFLKEKQAKAHSSTREQTYSENSQNNSYEYDFSFSDDTLKQWMQNAKAQACKLKYEVIDEFKGAIKEGSKSITNYLLTMFIPMAIGFLLFKACAH